MQMVKPSFSEFQSIWGFARGSWDWQKRISQVQYAPWVLNWLTDNQSKLTQPRDLMSTHANELRHDFSPPQFFECPKINLDGWKLP